MSVGRKRPNWPNPATTHCASVGPQINCTVPVPGVAQTIVVCRLRTVLELGRPRKTMACPTANLLFSYFLDTVLGSPLDPLSRNWRRLSRGGARHTHAGAAAALLPGHRQRLAGASGIGLAADRYRHADRSLLRRAGPRARRPLG